METRISVITIVMNIPEAEKGTVEKINELLHGAGVFVVGRMGIPYREKNVNIINVVVDAPQNVVSALAGKMGKIPGISVKTSYTNVITQKEA